MSDESIADRWDVDSEQPGFAFEESEQEFEAQWDPEKHPRGQPDNAGQFVEAGGGDGKELWQKTRKEVEGIDWDKVAKGEAGQPSDDAYAKMHERVEEWRQASLAAVSLGKISLEDLEKQTGFYITSGDKFVDLPETLYHVTTSADAVEKDGLKSRYELGQMSGKGLGGGDDKSISFTADLKTAEAIRDAFQEAHDVATGERTVQQMLDEAKAGKGANKEWYSDIARSFNSGWKAGDPTPPGLDAVLRGQMLRQGTSGKPPMDDYDMHGDKIATDPSIWKPAPFDKGWSGAEDLHSYWERPETPDEARAARFNFYQTFAFMREHAGGKMDPLFFTSDTKALATMNPKKDIAIMQYKPVKGAKGVTMSALGEWRTYTGKAVKLVKRH